MECRMRTRVKEMVENLREISAGIGCGGDVRGLGETDG